MKSRTICTMKKTCVNRGSLGSASLLTKSLTLINWGDTITVEALWELGSESLFFSANLLPFAVNKKRSIYQYRNFISKSLKAKRGSRTGSCFPSNSSRGKTVTIRLLQQTGLELQALKLKSKILTCSEEFANKYDLDRAAPCPNGQRCLMKPPAKLSLILGMDLHHMQPKLVEQFNNNHSFLGLYACFCQTL